MTGEGLRGHMAGITSGMLLPDILLLAEQEKYGFSASGAVLEQPLGRGGVRLA
jgi:hypothetical protein